MHRFFCEFSWKCLGTDKLIKANKTNTPNEILLILSYFTRIIVMPTANNQKECYFGEIIFIYIGW